MTRLLPQFTAKVLMMSMLTLVSTPRVDAGEVMTAGGRVEGQVVFTADGVRVGDRSISWHDVRSLRTNQAARTYGQPNLLRMRSGEVWAVQVLRLLDDDLHVRSPLIGERAVPAGQVAEIVLNRQAMSRLGSGGIRERASAAEGILVTATGEALPGDLMWISEQAVAVESLLGVMQMPRDSTAAYRFGEPVQRSDDAAAADADAITLVGGGRLTGEIKVRAGGVTLNHRTLGLMDIDGGEVRSIHRSIPGAVMLADLTPQKVEARRLFASSRLPDLPGPGRSNLRLWSGGTVTYELPHPGRLEATLRAVPGMRGRAVLRVISDDNVLVTKVIDAGGAAQWLSVDVPAGEVVLEASFGEVVSVPSGVELVEPRLMTR